MIGYYSSITFISCLAGIAMCVVIFENDKLNKTKKRGFITVFSMMVYANIAEWIGWMLGGVCPAVVIMILKVSECCVIPTVAVIWLNTMREKRCFNIYAVFGVANIAVQTALAFGGLVYYVDADGMLRAGDYHFIYVIVYLVSMLEIGVGCILFSRRYEDQNIPSLAAILIFSFISVLSNVAHPEIHLDWFATMIAFFMLYAYCMRLFNQVDSLTSLLDRFSYDTRVSELDRSAIFVLLDIDSFKQLNDEHGHDIGDECLKKVADAMKRTYHRFGYCFRIGGDEFCAVLTKTVWSIEELNARFNENLKAEQGSLSYPLPNVSIGYGVYTPGVNSVADAAKDADSMMYTNKKLSKQRSAKGGDQRD